MPLKIKDINLLVIQAKLKILNVIGVFMIVVYVKHYLNAAGRSYFNGEWYPYVESIIREQPGFIALESYKEDASEPECINITVKFANEATLMAWVAHELHQKVINNLDPYRTRGQRLFVSDGSPAPALDKWEEAPLPPKASGGADYSLDR